jgi:hypothetical protein
LGIAQDEVDEAVEAHGIIKVLDHLRSKVAGGQTAQTQDGQPSIEDQIAQAIDQHMAPIHEQENKRLTDAANTRFEQIVHTSIVEAFKTEGVDVANIPADESFMLMNATSEILKYDEPALIRLKQGQGQADIQKAFQQAKTFLDKYYLSRAGRERGRVQGPPQVRTPQGQQRKPTLDEMIEEPTLVNPKYKQGT